MKYLLLLLLVFATSISLRAQELYPPLDSAAVVRLQHKLWQTPRSTRRVDLLLQISDNLVTIRDEQGEPLDSAFGYSQQAAALSEALHYVSGQIHCLVTQGRIFQYLDKKAAGRLLLQQAIARSQQQGTTRLGAESWFRLGSTYERSPAEMPQRISCFQKAMAQYQQLHDQEKATYVLQTIADMHYVQGKYSQARQELLQVLAQYHAINYYKLHYTSDLLVPVDIKLGNYQEALQFGLATIASAKATKDTIYMVRFYLRVASIYEDLNQIKANIEYLNKALLFAKNGKSAQYVQFISIQLVRSLIALHQPQQALALFKQETSRYPATDDLTRFNFTQGFGICYLATKQYGLAEMYALQGIKLAENMHKLTARDFNIQLNYAADLLISRIYVATQQYDKARYFLDKALALENTSATVKTLALYHLLLFKADSAQGKFPNAITNYQRYKALNDSVFNEKNSRQIAGLRIQYDTEKREHSMALLTKQNAAQQASLRQREFQRNVLLIGALLLVLLLGLSYNRYLLKQRSALLLEAKQTEINRKNESLELVLTEKDQLLEDKEWMLKEIHHRVKNNLQIITSLLDSQAVYLKDKAALSAIRESQNRVHSMALIHQKLYQGTQLASVPMQAYVHEIVNYLIASFDSQHFVRAELAVADIALDVSLAVPVGLILNEAITNSLKYAFPAQQPGILRVELTHTGKTYTLTLSDDGVGLPPDFDPTRNGTLGMSLIRGLSKQIDGQLQITGLMGVHITLAFDDIQPVFPTAPDGSPQLASAT